jgi:AAA domain
MNELPVEPAYRLRDRPDEQRWLVAALWAEEAVGIIRGEPKCCKSFLALDLAVCVAAGTPGLRRFAVKKPGRVLLYAAEDALHIVRRRLDGICAAAGVDLTDLDLQVITAPSLRLDLETDRSRLTQTVARLKPRRLGIDENVSGEVAPLLAYLRDLQRRHGLACKNRRKAAPDFGRKRQVISAESGTRFRSNPAPDFGVFGTPDQLRHRC